MMSPIQEDAALEKETNAGIRKWSDASTACPSDLGEGHPTHFDVKAKHFDVKDEELDTALDWAYGALSADARKPKLSKKPKDTSALYVPSFFSGWMCGSHPQVNEDEELLDALAFAYGR
eukprot:TRINITY_DN115464_c0_g1_i1.p1 TRINITY_DN115464_c0_g1~~TRINITY_DN115464_c0_g1_i1.p1  ORF type:complete len:119 (-),score=23.43 TRINITY_DN115464_c0_g1_i1:189-545(-)